MINYLMTKGGVTLHYDGNVKVVAAGDDRYNKVLLAIKEDRLDDIPALVEVEKYFKERGLDIEDGLLSVNGEAMPPELSDRILAYKAANLPFDSLLKFWDNLKQNPSFNSRKQLFRFLENKGHSLTPDGCFVGYRGIRSDFKDKHSGKFDNSPGQTIEVPRESVDDNPNNTCSYGLHVGGYEYAKDFGSGGKLVLVKVNPKDVVAVPTDYNGQKMRVCKFEVLSEVASLVEDVVYGTTSSPCDDGCPIEDDEDEEYDGDDVESVLDSYEEYCERYDGAALITRIAEEVSHLTEGEITEILEQENKEL